MLRKVTLVATLGVLAAILYQGLVATWAYSTGSLTVPGTYVVVTPPASPAPTRPLIYCTGTNPTVAAGKKGTVTVTCYNGTNHTVTGTATYALAASSCTTCPNLTGNNNLSFTLTANGSATAAVSINTVKTTTPGTYAIGYNFTTPNSPAVDVSFGFTTTFQVN